MMWLSAFAMMSVPAQDAAAFQDASDRGVSNESVEIGQVSADRVRDIAIDQAPRTEDPRTEDSAANALEQAFPIGSRAIAGGQIERRAERAQSRTVAPQLQTVREPVAEPVVQLAGREDSSARDNSISAASEGRTARTTVPDGPDRCDPATPSERPAVCRAVIETRAVEFRQDPRPALSPEERLIAERSELARDRSALASARIGIPPSSNDKDGQVLASLVLGTSPSPQDTKPDEPGLGTETQTLIDAIVSGLTLPTVPQP